MELPSSDGAAQRWGSSASTLPVACRWGFGERAPSYFLQESHIDKVTFVYFEAAT